MSARGRSLYSLCVAEKIRLPELGEGLSDGEITRWLVREGDRIAVGDPLLELQTDKAILEVTSTAAGVVLALVAAEGDVVAVDGVVAIVGEEGEPMLHAVAGPAAEAAQPERLVAIVPDAPPEAVRATTAARDIARMLGVDIRSVRGSGAGGRITEDDVRGAAAAAQAGETRIAVRGMRRAIVEQVVRTHREVPAVTFVEECDFTAVDLEVVLPRTLQAVAQALRHHPELNACIDGDEIVLLDRVDIGIVVTTDDGLVVPVVRGCAERPVAELEREVGRLTAAALDGKLTPDDVRGSTFTVTHAGALGGLFVTPLINHPEVAILGVHRIGMRPVVRDGAIVGRMMGHVSVTFDHRVVDGAGAAAFCLDVIGRLEGGT